MPLYAAEHIHVSTDPDEGAHDLLPLMRALDGSFYARHHAGGLMVGTFEPRGRPRSTDDIPDDWSFGEFGPTGTTSRRSAATPNGASQH